MEARAKSLLYVYFQSIGFSYGSNAFTFSVTIVFYGNCNTNINRTSNINILDFCDTCDIVVVVVVVAIEPVIEVIDHPQVSVVTQQHHK